MPLVLYSMAKGRTEVFMADQEATARQQLEELELENGEGKRERSTIEFPYLDLDAGVEVAKGVYDLGGSSADGISLRRI